MSKSKLTTLSLCVPTEEVVWKFNAKCASCVDDLSFDLWYLQFNHHVGPREAQIRIAVRWVPAFVVDMDLKDRDARIRFQAFGAQSEL